jgi:hypothetical protein
MTSIVKPLKMSIEATLAGLDGETTPERATTGG